jgi:outer membrane protein TolC
MLLLNTESRGIRINPQDSLRLYGPKVDFYESLKVAIENRKDYKKAKNEIEKKGLSLSIKKNSLWPEIDLEASFARNGLAQKYKDAFQDVFKEDNPEIFVGVTIKVPLENRLAKGQYNKAKLQKARAIVELKKTERSILTEINDLVTRVNIQTGRVLTQRRVLSLQERKLNAEDKRFKFGRSSSDILIRYQEDLLNAKLAYARALFKYNLILIDLSVAQSTLLSDNWEVEL